MPPSSPSTDKFKRYRAQLRARGLRQIPLWVPDIYSRGFQQDLARQIRETENVPGDIEALDLIEQVGDGGEVIKEGDTGPPFPPHFSANIHTFSH